MKNIEIPTNGEVSLQAIEGNCIELAVEIDPENAREIGVKVRCSPDNAEQTLITYLPGEAKLLVDFANSTTEKNVSYRDDATKQEAPFQLKEGEHLKLRIFIDRSILEVFANGRQCITQRIYPSKADSMGVRLFAKGGTGKAIVVKAWDMEPVAPW